MDPLYDIKAPMSHEQALNHLESLEDVPHDLFVISRLIAAHACYVSRSPDPRLRILSGKEGLVHLSELSGLCLSQLYAGIDTWIPLYKAVRTLGLPNTQSSVSFFRAWRKMGDSFPFYEQYMISAGRAKEFITNRELAKVMGTKIADAESLHEYRKVLRLAEDFPAKSDSDANDVPTPTSQHTGDQKDTKEQLRHIQELIQALDVLPTDPIELNNRRPTNVNHPHPKILGFTPQQLQPFTTYTIGLFILTFFYSCDPNETAGSIGLGRYLRILPTMITLLDAFYAVTASVQAEGEILQLLILCVIFARAVVALERWGFEDVMFEDV
ncbi:MAG: hypothetical protein Q9219_002659 [cf. Caloplaca sp. 3 TL-2023]